MPDTIIESVLTEKLDATLLLKWLNNESLEDTPDDCILNCCNRNEFVTCFLSYLRNQTDSILQTNSNAVQILQHSTPEKLLSTRRKHRRSISEPTSEDRTMDSLTVKSDRQRSHESPSKDRKRTGRRVKTKLFTDEKSINQSVSSDESRLSTGVDRITLTSTPMKNGMNPHDYPNLPLTSPVTPRSFVKDQYERCDTPRLSHRHSRSQEKSCLGDYMVIAQKSSKKKKGRSSTDNEESKQELDLTNSEMFPEIGARKASSLRSDKRRIKPTNIDKSEKSVSLNSFSMESIHTSPLHVEENSAFKHQRVQIKESNNFEVERNILKQERHKLMEKFNILNTSLPQKPMPTPQIKITQKKVVKTQNYIKSDVTKIVFKEKLDLLVDIYECLLRNNLIMSLNTEIYFLISILISKQFEEDYIMAENKLTVSDMGFLLKTIHNSTYFAVKSLWHQRVILEVILDKSSLKTLGENKKIRSFYPDLAKFLLNCYGLRCEAETNQDRSRQTETRSNGVICFNFETDNADNFPSMLSFQNFKKQRDMFYEILRWYQDSQTSGSSRSSLRARVKALLACSTSPSNHRHLASLFTLHMLAHCLPTSAQESKLSKLQRRLTCPNAPECHRLPHFTEQETFYKEFIINAENEAFRAHLRDSIANEITALDSTHIATDERGNYNAEVTNQYLSLSKKLALLSKFLGLLASLPYTQVVSDLSSKVPKIVHKENNYAPPKEKVLENDLALRNYSQPTMDLKGILANAIEAGRLSITIPWIVHYLSMLDYTSLRIKYYQNLLKILFDVYSNRLKLENSNLKKNTIIYLKSMLGWLFDLPHFPHESFYENRLSNSVGVDMNIDSCDIIDESVIIELCPHLRDLNVLLSTCRVSQEQKEMGSYRHITPVSLILNPEDRIKNKEKELQARLEEELLKSQPSSTRRVLELVIERVTSACVRELSGHILTEHRQRASRLAARLVATSQLDQCALLTAVQQVYSSQLSALVSAARTAGRASLRARARGAVSALLSAAPPPLVALVLRAATTRLDKWLTDNWNTTAVLSKDIEAEMKTFLALGELATATTHKTTVDVTAMTSPDHVFFATNVSPASCIINLKEQLCQLLSGEECNTSQLYSVLSSCALACSASNVFGRPPTHRAILQLSVDLCVVFVSRKPEEVTDSFLSSLHAIWNVCCPDRKRSPPQEVMLPERREELSPEFRNFDDDEQVKTPISDDETKPTKIIILLPDKTEKPQEKSEKSIQEKESDECDLNLDFFNRILCPRNIMLLSAGNSVAWEAMGTVLVFLLTNDYLSEDSLTEQCLAVYRQDWSQNVLESLSTCMKSVSARWSRSSTGKFTLFLDFLAEYCGDMDYEPME